MCFYFRSEANRDEYLKGLARDNTQLLLNKIWELPIERVEEAIVAKLPAPTFVLPREKPLPKPKPLTKWQKYAQEKGITKTKKSKLNWDETLQVNSRMIFYFELFLCEVM
jgi:regulator of ribosome biosynthesis